mgnify:CR=1 FL=1
MVNQTIQILLVEDDDIDAEAIARDTLAFVEVKSETGAEGPGSDFLAALLEREGFNVTRDFVEPCRPNIYATLQGDQPGPTLAFNGHTDTIPIGISTPPGRDGDWITGRGTEDMKGGLVAMVHAASAIRKAGVKLAGNLLLTGVIGHETPIGKKEGPRRLIQQFRRSNHAPRPIDQQRERATATSRDDAHPLLAIARRPLPSVTLRVPREGTRLFTR